MLAKRGGNALAALDVGGGSLDGFFHDRVANRLGNDLQDFENRHAAANQRSERAGKPGEANLMRNGPKNGQLDTLPVPKITASLGFDIGQPAPDPQTGNDNDVNQVVLDDFADGDHDLGWPRQLGTKTLVNLLERGNHPDQ